MARGTKENCHGNIMQIPRSEDGKYSNSNQSKLFYPETQQSYSVLCVLTMSKHLGSIKSTKTKLLF